MGAIPCLLVEVTAADRAAATCQRLIQYKLISGNPKGWRGRLESCQTGSVPRLVSEGHETVACGGFAATPRLLPRKEANHSRSDWRRIHSSTAAMHSPGKKAYPQSAYRKGGVFNLRLNTPVAKATLLFRKRNSEPLTAPSAEGVFWRTSTQSLPRKGRSPPKAGGGSLLAYLHAKPPLKGEVPA